MRRLINHAVPAMVAAEPVHTYTRDFARWIIEQATSALIAGAGPGVSDAPTAWR